MSLYVTTHMHTPTCKYCTPENLRWTNHPPSHYRKLFFTRVIYMIAIISVCNDYHGKKFHKIKNFAHKKRQKFPVIHYIITLSDSNTQHAMHEQTTCNSNIATTCISTQHNGNLLWWGFTHTSQFLFHLP